MATTVADQKLFKRSVEPGSQSWAVQERIDEHLSCAVEIGSHVGMLGKENDLSFPFRFVSQERSFGNSTATFGP